VTKYECDKPRVESTAESSFRNLLITYSNTIHTKVGPDAVNPFILQSMLSTVLQQHCFQFYYRLRTQLGALLNLGKEI